jgi:hypothetical protein
MLTDDRFRALAGTNLEVASREAGYLLTPGELRLLAALQLTGVAELAVRLEPGLRRAGGSGGKITTD